MNKRLVMKIFRLFGSLKRPVRLPVRRVAISRLLQTASASLQISGELFAVPIHSFQIRHRRIDRRACLKKHATFLVIANANHQNVVPTRFLDIKKQQQRQISGLQMIHKIIIDASIIGRNDLICNKLAAFCAAKSAVRPS